MQNVQENELHVQQEMIENADLFLAVTLMLCRLQNRILEILVKRKKIHNLFLCPRKLCAAEVIMFSLCPVVPVPTSAFLSLSSLRTNSKQISMKFAGCNQSLPSTDDLITFWAKL